LRDVLLQPVGDVAELRDLAVPGAHQLRRPAADLALDVAGGFAQPVEAYRRPVQEVDVGQGVDQLFRQAQARPLVRLVGGRQLAADGDPVHSLHQVEGRADHLEVVAVDDRPRHRHAGAR
jgi:hypothetical protein